jgi:hypothetical protein
MDEKELEDEIFPIIRPIEISDPIFKNCSGYLSKFFSTDKNADPVYIQWLLKKRKLVDKRKVELVKALQLGMYDLIEQLEGCKKSEEAKLKKQIYEDELLLARLRSKLVYVSEVNADDVRPILGDKWYYSKKRGAKKRDWDVIYLNKDPDTPGEAFYPSFSIEKNVYQHPDDVDPHALFIIAFDYQHTVAPMPIAQLSTLPGADRVSLNYVDEVYSVYPEGLREAVKKFCNKYKNHLVKAVYYVYDHTAKGKRLDADSYTEIVVSEFEKYGWTVYPIYTGQAPEHYDKYVDTKDWMDNAKGEYYDIRVNSKCEKLIISIQGSAAKTVGNKTKKDKSGELESTLDQTETTHFSDAFDMINDAVLKQKLISEVLHSSGFAFR